MTQLQVPHHESFNGPLPVRRSGGRCNDGGAWATNVAIQHRRLGRRAASWRCRPARPGCGACTPFVSPKQRRCYYRPLREGHHMSRSPLRGLIRPALGALVLLAGGTPAWCQQPQPVQHEFRIRHFRTEGGVELPEVRIVYGTYGHLDAAGDNAILLPSHYMADMHGYAWLIGPGKALDPGKLFLITSEVFGNGRSSSPSNTPVPFHGPRFPVMTIRDNVRAVHELLTEELHVHHLRAVIGFSMGAQQAFQWAVSYPDFMDRIVATSGTAKTYGHGIVRLESQITALTTDPAFDGGNYKVEPEKGIQAFSLVCTAWLFSQEG